MAVGWGEVVRRGWRPPPILFFWCFTLFTYYKNFFSETIILFRKQLQVNFKYQQVFNLLNRSKNIKCFEFYVKTLYRECRDMAKNLWLWWNVIYQLFKRNIS